MFVGIIYNNIQWRAAYSFYFGYYIFFKNHTFGIQIHIWWDDLGTRDISLVLCFFCLQLEYVIDLPGVAIIVRVSGRQTQ